jgi:phosphatidylethanolamine/phosphatidyl-N-methylethanolamine N-methyltransferase
MSRVFTPEEIAADSRRVERVYSVLARVYDGFFDWALGPGRRAAVTRLPVSGGDRILEIGVGTGLSLPLYPASCHVTGIDITDAMLDRARSRMVRSGQDNVELRRMDARDLKFPDGSFDAVVAPYVVSVVPDPSRVMAEAARVCRPGGVVAVVNRFRSAAPVLHQLDGWFTPLTQWIGFRLDLPLDTVTSTPGLTVERIDRVNLFRAWRLVWLRREDGTGGQ